MTPQTARHLDGLAEITDFAKQHAFNDADELTLQEFIADQILHRCTQLAEDCSFLIQNGHDLSAAILQRAVEERVALLGYLNKHNQFREFQNFSMAQEYQDSATHHVRTRNRPRPPAKPRSAGRQKSAVVWVENPLSQKATGGSPSKEKH